MGKDPSKKLAVTSKRGGKQNSRRTAKIPAIVVGLPNSVEPNILLFKLIRNTVLPPITSDEVVMTMQIGRSAFV